MKAGISNVRSAVLLLFVCLTVRFVEQRFFLMLYLLFFLCLNFYNFQYANVTDEEDGLGLDELENFAKMPETVSTKNHLKR